MFKYMEKEDWSCLNMEEDVYDLFYSSVLRNLTNFPRFFKEESVFNNSDDLFLNLMLLFLKTRCL